MSEGVGSGVNVSMEGYMGVCHVCSRSCMGYPSLAGWVPLLDVVTMTIDTYLINYRVTSHISCL